MTTNKKTIVLGVDPGSIRTGFALIDISLGLSSEAVIDYGVIKLSSKTLLSKRIRIIFEKIQNIIDLFSPEALSIETQFIGKNPQGILTLGMIRGVVLLSAELKEIPVFSYTPSSAKLAAVGNGAASKYQVHSMIRKFFEIPELSKPEDEDIADAFALALCYANQFSSVYAKNYRT